MRFVSSFVISLVSFAHILMAYKARAVALSELFATFGTIIELTLSYRLPFI